jgi:UDP-N-acetylmuramoyl-L-alanyl-D-glutamate--2,6-diaminopimelate ligase
MNNDISEFLGMLSSVPIKVRIDSRNVCPGDAFVAVKGTLNDGHAFIKEAIARGATAVLCEHIPEGLIDNNVKFTLVSDTEHAMGDIAKKVYDDPSRKMRTYGITGTNGKTTTAFLMHHILQSAGLKCGLISTVYNIASDDMRSPSTMTTPGVMELNRLLSQMVNSGKKAAVIEVSSHALEQRRVSGLGLDRALFTNITPEHLDYHKSMKAYLEAKAEIFGLFKAGGLGVVNADDPLVVDAARLSEAPGAVTFGIDSPANVQARNIQLYSGGAEFDIMAEGYGEIHITTHLVGKHNVSNILAASAALISDGIDMKIIGSAIEGFAPVPGRFERIDHSGSFNVFVDYAHTPDALENVLTCLRELTEKKLICVFGCGGDRDRAKRPMMGEIASSIADHVILTSDNPRSEMPNGILRQIEKGVIGRDNYSIIESRREAILAALAMAESGDSVIIAGKGHENYQIIGDQTLHFDDRETAGQVLREMGY